MFIIMREVEVLRKAPSLFDPKVIPDFIEKQDLSHGIEQGLSLEMEGSRDSRKLQELDTGIIEKKRRKLRVL